ncbi:hypothetical protein VFMJ11_B0164 (plasmid) [Aliivibrio fischeri MJ11]|uniref:Uncharacterized protein n=1 Tax=Aliivibrio fischeri (strain MJ11) TaxID=388396 RepID=B5EWA6_ALIFM|nr:hypothetical protein [Aliivibrio fischeri]ACH64780.1 hypothetical protein VFMJ11_B0164 [Aliivibrio fischeri MJ11]
MAFSKVIFNKAGHWHWFLSQDDTELSLHLKREDLEDTWYVAELFYPEEPSYDVTIHDNQIKKLLSKPNELVVFELSESLKNELISYN